MAITFGTVSSAASGTSSTTVVITKPTSLAEGDLMVAHLSFNGANEVTAVSLSGWTEVHITSVDSTGASGKLVQWTAWKIASAADAAASNFTFTITVGGSVPYIGRIARFTSTRTASAIKANEASLAEASGSTVTVATVTPDFANSFAIILASTGASAVVTHSTYAMVTSNPTWTEAYDSGYDDGAFAVSQAMAYGSRPEATASGNITFVIGTADRASIGHAGFITPPQTISQTETVTATDTKIGNISAVIDESVTMTDTEEETVGKYRNNAKNSASWVNPDKS